jgi:predicted alpha/beta-hydrolase family hydrolase
MKLTWYDAKQPVATLVLAHGAGAGQKSAWMVKTAQALAERGITVATFDFPYMSAGRSVPDKAPVLEAAWRVAFDEATAAKEVRNNRSGRVFIGGKSMGGRIATHIAAQGVEHLAGVVLLGYPLHPSGQPGKRRDAHLPQIKEPVLFVQGSSDTFGTADEIKALLPSMPKATLHVIEGGDHSFKVKGGAAKVAAAFDEVIATVDFWVRQH